jgi:hypothetical protein
VESYILIVTLVMILYYLIRPISKNEKNSLEDKTNWRGGF